MSGGLYHRAGDATIDIMSELVSVRCKAVLFDMDGTLVDSTLVVELAWGGWAVRRNIPLEDVLSFSHGRPTIATLEHFLPGRDDSEELEELSRFEETQTEGILTRLRLRPTTCISRDIPARLISA